MIRETKFLISRSPYAVDLNSFEAGEPSHYPTGTWWGAGVNAVWFRRRNGLTVACIGTLRHSSRTEVKDAVEFLTNYTDGRYGGDCHGRWDGERYWGAQEPEVMEQHLAVLRPMLDNYPALPEGYDGWWTFRGSK